MNRVCLARLTGARASLAQSVRGVAGQERLELETRQGAPGVRGAAEQERPELEVRSDVFSARPTRSLLRTLAIYQVFVAGAEQRELAQVAATLQRDNIQLMLTSMLEADVDEEAASERQLEANLEEALRVLTIVREVTAGQDQAALQAKFTAHLNADLLVHISRVFSSSESPSSLVEQLANAMVTSGQVSVPGLTSEQQYAWDSCVRRLQTLGEACADSGMLMFVDGEFTYTNPAISWLTLALMAVFNQREAFIRGTHQCYLKATPANLEREYAICQQLGACFGGKLVRGAYMARERQLAQQEGRASPVCDSYEATTLSYTRAVEFALRRVAEDGGRTQIMVATHNHESILHALGLARRLGVVPFSGGLAFAQIYGMADYLTVPLGRAGHRVFKAVPFGEFTTVMPYLSRRAAESRLVQQGVRVEKQLLLRELASRV
ncbi:hydroxyproline dehydrogenase-like [Pollicipes pollicipes]|uniref:hydroxyproline dehydrogenase-like n=1 Tax=Pollicipes pollicipes TaxID=41117 RepID=UPI001884D3F0|nr:hydroxyproline dehydrogenase-like [Pollicipes pollicipes]